MPRSSMEAYSGVISGAAARGRAACGCSRVSSGVACGLGDRRVVGALGPRSRRGAGREEETSEQQRRPDQAGAGADQAHGPTMPVTCTLVEADDVAREMRKTLSPTAAAPPTEPQNHGDL